jgi:hypothetical protein
MDTDNIQRNMSINDIGSIARTLDTELTIFERMKIKKSILLRMLGAAVVYLTIMSLFSIFL